jgi:hypothetical protein
MAIDVDGDVPPTFLRRLMLVVTATTGVVAGVGLAAVVLTALFGGEGESPLGLALVGAGAGVVILHAAALGQLLLRRRQGWLFRNGVVLGGIGLLAVSGAAVVGAALDDAPGGVLAGLLLAIQGGAAVLTVAFPQLVPQRTPRA